MSTEATKATTKGGLDGVIVADTRLSDVDGDKGTLVIGGYDAEWLAEHATYEAAVSLLEGVLDKRRFFQQNVE